MDPEKGIGSLREGVTGGCELPGVVTENQTLQGPYTLCPLSCFSSTFLAILNGLLVSR